MLKGIACTISHTFSALLIQCMDNEIHSPFLGVVIDHYRTVNCYYSLRVVHILPLAQTTSTGISDAIHQYSGLMVMMGGCSVFRKL